MRNLSLATIPLLLLFSVSASGEVFKCTIAGKVEYRDMACASNAEQQLIAVDNNPLCGATPAPPDAMTVAAQLRLADQALSERLAHERELRMQIVAQDALAARQERIASEMREAAELQYDNVPVVGAYWPFRPVRWPGGQHIVRTEPASTAQPHQTHRRWAGSASFATHRQSPIRAGSFATGMRFE